MELSLTCDKMFNESDRNFIINQYPQNVRQYVDGVENPLDISQILRNISKIWNVRMIFIYHGTDDIDTYYCAIDIANVLDYTINNMHHWNKWTDKNERFLIEEIENDPLQNGGGHKIEYSFPRSGIKNGLSFLSESGLRKILIKVNKPNAKEYSFLLDGMATAIQKIMKHMCVIRVKQLEQHVQQIENNRLTALKEKEEVEEKLKKQREEQCFKTTQRKREMIYIVTTTEYMKRKVYKVGKTDNLHRRLKEYNGTGISISDQYFYVFKKETTCANAVEQSLKHLIPDYKEDKNKEMYQMHGPLLIKILDKLVDLIEAGVEFTNEEILNAVGDYDTDDNLEKIIIEEPKMIENKFSVEEVLSIVQNVMVEYTKNNNTNVIKFSDIRDELKRRLLLHTYTELHTYKENLRVALKCINTNAENKIVLKLSR